MAEREPALVTPFWVRIATETKLSPGWLLIAFPAVLYPTYLALEALFGRGLVAAVADIGGDFEARILLTITISLGYISMAYTYTARGTFRDLEELRPVLRKSENTYTELRHQLTCFDRRRLWFGGLFGLAVSCVLMELAVGRWTRLLAGEWSIRDPCGAAIGFAFWIVAGVGTMYLIDSSRVYSRIGEQHVAIDLLDLSPLSPLTRHGLRITLLLTIITALGLVAAIVGPPSPYSATTSRMVPMSVVCLWNVLLAAAAFVLPVRGLQRHIRARKAEELARVREDIRIDHELVATRGAESAEAGARLPGLIAYMNQIESVREWPFDAPTLTRFFLYVAIPLGSWIGGALVERLLGVALD